MNFEDRGTMQSKTKLLQLPPDAVENIRKKYNIDRPERRQETLELLEDWVRKQTHFIKRDFSKEYLEITLILCKGSVEKAKKQLDSLCTMKTVLPNFFCKTCVREELQSFVLLGHLLPMPKMIDHYYRVALLRLGDKDFQKTITPQTFMECYQYSVIMCEYIIKHDYLDGLVMLIDFRGVNIVELVTKVNTVEMQQFTAILTKAYGTRLRNIYLLSESKTIELFVKIIKQFLSQKISSRVHVLANLEELYKCVPKEVLPKDYGGNEKPTDVLKQEWVEVLSSEEHVEYMRMMNRAGTDESRRPAARFNQDCMGMPGSFRNLTVD